MDDEPLYPEHSPNPDPAQRQMFQIGEDPRLVGFGGDADANDSSSDTSSETRDSSVSGGGVDPSDDSLDDEEYDGNESEVEEMYVTPNGLPFNGIPVELSFPTNERHHRVLKRITKALEQRKNLLLEWPSDKDRRLTVLSGILSYWQWKRGHQQNEIHGMTSKPIDVTPPKIYYLTKTIEDISPVVNHLNRIGTPTLFEDLKINILGRRRDLCINSEVTNNPSSADTKCLRLVKNGSLLEQNPQHGGLNICDYCPSSSDPRDQSIMRYVSLTQLYKVQDIEDLHRDGRATKTCPYYQSRNIQQSSTGRRVDLVICTQEFALSSVAQEDSDINFDNSIVVFDDGYHIEKVCAEEASSQISVTTLDEVVPCLKNVAGYLESESMRGTEIEDANELRANILTLTLLLDSLCEWMVEHGSEGSNDEEIRSFLSMKFQPERIQILKDGMKHVVRLCTLLRFPVIPKIELFNGIRKFLTVLQYFYNNENYNYYLDLKCTDVPRETRQTRRQNDIVLKLICANPSIVFSPIANVAHSIILTAGCLAPVHSIETELKNAVEFHDIKIIPRHEMPSENCVFAYCEKGPSNRRFTLDFRKRRNPKVIKEVSKSILQLCEKVPRGALVLFQAEEVLHKVWTFCNDPKNEPDGNSIMGKLESIKHVISEQDMVTDADQERLLAEYRRYNDFSLEDMGPRKGAVLFALARGKLSKKVSLANYNVHLVIHVSIPFGSYFTDDYIMAKRDYFKTRSNGRGPMENSDWYNQEAFRVMNQWFGYSVDNSSQWGVMVVLDQRMVGKQDDFKTLVPGWVRNRNQGERAFKRYDSFNSLLQSVKDLVMSMGARGNNNVAG